MSISTWVVVSLVCLVACARMAGAAADPVVTTTPTGDYSTFRLDLKGGGVKFEGKKLIPIDVSIHLGLRDRKVVNAWFAHPAMSGSRILWLDRSTLTFDGKRFVGELTGRTNLNWGSKVVHDFTYKIDAKLEANTDRFVEVEIKGTFTALFRGEDGSKVDLGGKIKHSWFGIKEAKLFAHSQNWPHYYGDGHGFAGPSHEYRGGWVDDLKKARPVWKSEAFIPTGYGSAPDSRYFDRAGLTDAGGGSSSPVVADGRVYQFYYYPRGPVGLDRAYGKYTDEDDLKAKARELFPKREIQQQWVVNHFRTQADEVLVCMDIMTGQTLWKTTMPQRGNNYQTHKHRGLFPVPLVAGGVVYQAGTTGRLYALDAKTGKLLWEYPDAKPEAHVTTKGGIDCHAPSPVLVSDVVLYAAGKGVIGVEAKTGKKKWDRPLWTRSSLLPWKGKERTLVIATDRNHEKKEDYAVALDPADGKVVWREKVDYLTGYTFPLLAGDVLVGYSLKKEKVKPGENDGLALIHAYRVSEKGLTKAWTTAPLAPVVDTVGLAIDKGRVYVSTAAKAFCLSLDKGETLAVANDVGGARTQTAFVADGRLFIQPEGRHGKQSFFMLDADPKNFKVLGRPWLPPHSWTTAYASQPIVYPLVGGRLFVRGLDAVYCYEVRAASR